VAVGGLAVHSLLDHRLGRVRGLTLLHLLLFPCVLLCATADTMKGREGEGRIKVRN